MTKQQANLILAGIVFVIGVQVLFATGLLPVGSRGFAGGPSARSRAQLVLDQQQRIQIEQRAAYAAEQARLSEALHRVQVLEKELAEARKGSSGTGAEGR